jgi:PAS domain S-box-containing protein
MKSTPKPSPGTHDRPAFLKSETWWWRLNRLGLSIFTGMIFAWILATFQKMHSGIPLVWHGYGAPTLIGGILGGVVGALLIRLSRRSRILERALEERLETERALADQTERLDHIVRGTHVGTWEWNVQTGETVFNERWAEIVGYTLDELAPVSIETWAQRCHPDDLARSNALLEQCFRGASEYYDCEVRMRHNNGEWVWVHDRGRVASWTDDGKPLRMFGTHNDITERKRQELALQRAETKFRTIYNAAGEALMMLDRSGFFDCNQTSLALFGVESVVQFSTFHPADLSPDRQADGTPSTEAADERIETALREGSCRFEWLHRRFDTGEVFPAEVILTAIDLDGRAVVHASVRDITERKKAEQEVVQALIIAQRANAAKDNFMTVMSHEMRSPLNPIMGFSEILLEEEEDEQRRGYLRIIQEAAQRELDLVDNILNYTKLDKGMVKPIEQEFSVFELCRQALDEVRPVAKGLELHFDTPSNGELPAVSGDLEVRGPSNLLMQVLANLLNNGCKYTKAGSVTLKVQFEESTGEGTHVFGFYVMDTGIGIREEHMKEIFEPFRQVDSSMSREFEGAGLGLAICKRIVEQLGGKIGVGSTHGAGSTFWFHVPLEVLQAEDREAAADPAVVNNAPVSGGRVLIVEDRASNARLAESILQRSGAITEIAASGEDGLRRCRQTKFDLILLDLAMPGMTGLEAAQTLRASDGPNRETPIWATTSDGAPDVEVQCLEAGMNGYLVKPILPEQLKDVLRTIG